LLLLLRLLLITLLLILMMIAMTTKVPMISIARGLYERAKASSGPTS
jgi:hypothetical protein